ncbi:MAG: ribonuclease HII [Candidatus Melainabacteria bacterium]
MTARRGVLNALLAFDETVRREQAGCVLVGVDEVGRGSLIGPVVAGACVLPETFTADQRILLADLNDSKKLTPACRQRLAECLPAMAWTGIGEASPREIEQLNIHFASLLALHRAYENLCARAGWQCDLDTHFLLVDGRACLPDIPVTRQQTVIKGDGHSAAIAAASVLAKHHRDSWVLQVATDYPDYGWQTNMGYATPAHQRALATYGPTPWHRAGFRPVQAQLSLL